MVIGLYSWELWSVRVASQQKSVSAASAGEERSEGLVPVPRSQICLLGTDRALISVPSFSLFYLLSFEYRTNFTH